VHQVHAAEGRADEVEGLGPEELGVGQALVVEPKLGCCVTEGCICQLSETRNQKFELRFAVVVGYCRKPLEVQVGNIQGYLRDGRIWMK